MSVGIIGAGFISRAHATALNALAIPISAVVDREPARAESFARRYGVPRAYGSLAEMIGEGGIEKAHVLVPPPLHREIAEPLLAAGIHVLVEKPMATSSGDCGRLGDAARHTGVTLAVNHNATFHAAFRCLMRAARALGPIRDIHVVYRMPVRQVIAHRYSHWMFDRPLNLLLEQALHPISQIQALLGPAESVSAEVLGRRSRVESFHPTWRIGLRCPRAAADLFFSVTEDFPVWTVTANCTDGRITADMVVNTCSVTSRTRFPDAPDAFFQQARLGCQSLWQAARNIAAYGAATVGFAGVFDPFVVSLRESVRDFHDSVRENRTPQNDSAAAAATVRTCEEIAEKAGLLQVGAECRARRAPSSAECDVVLIGGTGFMGRSLARRLLDRGLRVRVLARTPGGQRRQLEERGAEVQAGNMLDREDLARALRGARRAVALAPVIGEQGGVDAIGEMVEAARLCGELSIQLGIERLVHVGSIAALYLGNERDIVTASMPTDPLIGRRSIYTQGKAAAEETLRRMHVDAGLSVCILRPGIVVGAGSSPFHGALGIFNNSQHCIGWNAGHNPLPFVLLDDTAEALAAALFAEGVDGRSLNLVGDVRLSAREYIALLADALRRPLRFHPTSPARLAGNETLKWLVKRLAGRADAVLPTLRDLKSRGLVARFDCAVEKELLSWRPVAAREAFIERAIAVHAGDPAGAA